MKRRSKMLLAENAVKNRCGMTSSPLHLFERLRSIAAAADPRVAKASAAAEIVRGAYAYRWVGIYDVDLANDRVAVIAWSGPNAPRLPTFRTSQGLTGRAIAAQRIINVGNVAEDNDYLETLATTRSEIIVPALNDADEIVGTLDVESVEANAFDGEQELFLSRCVEELGPLWLHK